MTVTALKAKLPPVAVAEPAHRAAAGLSADLAGRLHGEPPVRDLRDLHHRDVADHHQHDGRRWRHSARLPQRRRRIVLRLNQFEFFTKIMVPSAAPHIFSGLRIGVGLAWLAIVAAKMLTGGVGIGFFIWDAWNSSLLTDIFVALLYFGITGFVLDRLVAFIGRVVSRGTMA